MAERTTSPVSAGDCHAHLSALATPISAPAASLMSYVMDSRQTGGALLLPDFTLSHSRHNAVYCIYDNILWQAGGSLLHFDLTGCNRVLPWIQ